MPFIGKQPAAGSLNTLLDAITTADNTAGYTLTKDSVAYTPVSAQSLMVSLNGVTQAPGAAYTVSGNTITFASDLMAADVIDYIIGFDGPKITATLDAGTVTVSAMAANSVDSAQYVDGSIDLVHMSATGTASATTFLRGDNSWAASGGLYATWAVKTNTNYTVVDSGEQIIMNSAAARTLTLPGSASVGDTVIVKNVGAGTVTIARNGLKIEGADQDGTLASTKAMQIVYVTTALGWKEV